MAKTIGSDSGRLDYDVVIIGAGITGINAAYRLQTECPNLTYVILDRREDLGGTWSFFKYPGIRSDSDLYTMGFSWKPWTKSNPIADGPSIVDYVRKTSLEYGIDKKIKYGYDVKTLNWQSKAQSWEVGIARTKAIDETIRCRFVIAGTGFFDYQQPRATAIPGMENFQGTVAHPQFWPEETDYVGKKVVVIGSGATAVTIVPVVAQRAAKTVMLQRSPTYIMSLPMKSPLDNAIRQWLPGSIAHAVVRWRMTILAWLFFYFTRMFPDAARSVLEKATKSELPPGVKYDPNFKPTYKVWDQRLCVCPDGDFFKSLDGGKAEVVTGDIKSVEKDGIGLESGEKIEADIIVTATGLKLQMLGGATITLDGTRVIEVGNQYMWRGTMLQDVPNLMTVIGYWNNSWTLGADLATKIFIKSIKRMNSMGASSFTPTMSKLEERALVTKPLWNMTSTYLQNNTYPKASTTAPWTVKDNYMRDWFVMKFGDLTTGLHFAYADQ